MKTRRIIFITVAAMTVAGGILFVLSEAGKAAKRKKAMDTAVPPGYAKTIIDEVAKKYGIR
jgi:hypothetical protein